MQDRQKVEPAVRILDKSVERALTSMDERLNSDDRAGMIFYLSLSRSIKDALMSRETPFLQRIKLLWAAYYQIKFWFIWMYHPKNPYPKSMRKLALPSTPLLETLHLTGGIHHDLICCNMNIKE